MDTQIRKRATEAVNCRSCRRLIVFLPTQAGKTMPVDASSVDPDDQMFEPGRHESHFATCPDADRFRKPRTKADRVKRAADRKVWGS